MSTVAVSDGAARNARRLPVTTALLVLEVVSSFLELGVVVV